MIDEKDRESILHDNGNILVTAGAGSGKTTTLTKKIINDLESNKKHYKIAAITFTRKAAKEIKDRLSGKTRGHFIGTNDGFVEQEIIKPFIKDAFGNEYSDQFEVVYNVDKFDTFKEGLDLIKYKNKLGTYKDNKKNFKFELALQILLKSRVAKQYIQARYFKLFIDEYQDCDQDMHKLFMYIKDALGIKLFIVGDPKQSIYQWRGAKPELFNDLINDNNNGFSKYELKENFRCCCDIQNYANILERHDTRDYKIVDEVQNVIGIESDINPLDILDLEKEIVILLRVAKTIAKDLENEINKNGYNFVYVPRTPLDDLGTENATILIELAKYVKNSNYTVYDLINCLPVELSKNEIKTIDQVIYRLRKSDVTEAEIEGSIIELFNILQIPFRSDDEISKFIESILDNQYDNAFNGKEYKHKIMTIHSAKGLEFEQVIIFSDDFKLHWNRDKNEHYVATTRGKEKLIIILNSEEYIHNLKVVAKKCNFDTIDRIIKII
ncbi:ATP-dependent helicase [Clostridium tunisiense]|uniref:ATP-dependent helicase n=1 Tax=Clostridium tunisiense TaxID=219748 RepID=UPI00030152FD|nr:ATP-dependent helicase [Clostridium tunisiense]